MVTKTEVKIFWITDFEEETAYLRRMHQSGWKFVKLTAGCFFHFESCPPEDVVYQLDFRGEKKGDDYLQLFEDYGWEHVADCNYFSIFRQLKQDVDVSIYSDSESQYEMVKRIFKSRYLTAFFLYVISSTLLLRSHPSFFLGISVVYLPILTYCAYRFYVLRNKYRK